MLTHEQRLGCTDRATIGGLASFWRHWLPRLEAGYASAADRARLAEASRLLADYGRTEPTMRRERIAACLGVLDRLGEVCFCQAEQEKVML